MPFIHEVYVLSAGSLTVEKSISRVLSKNRVSRHQTYKRTLSVGL